jgi:hypothetical protein
MNLRSSSTSLPQKRSKASPRRACGDRGAGPFGAEGQPLSYKIGTIKSCPRPPWRPRDRPYSEFFSFGNERLTQTSQAISRDDFKRSAGYSAVRPDRRQPFSCSPSGEDLVAWPSRPRKLTAESCHGPVREPARTGPHRSVWKRGELRFCSPYQVRGPLAIAQMEPGAEVM